jgi:hypothetical protein
MFRVPGSRFVFWFGFQVPVGGSWFGVPFKVPGSGFELRGSSFEVHGSPFNVEP